MALYCVENASRVCSVPLPKHQPCHILTVVSVFPDPYVALTQYSLSVGAFSHHHRHWLGLFLPHRLGNAQAGTLRPTPRKMSTHQITQINSLLKKPILAGPLEVWSRTSDRWLVVVTGARGDKSAKTQGGELVEVHVPCRHGNSSQGSQAECPHKGTPPISLHYTLLWGLFHGKLNGSRLWPLAL